MWTKGNNQDLRLDEIEAIGKLAERIEHRTTCGEHAEHATNERIHQIEDSAQSLLSTSESISFSGKGVVGQGRGWMESRVAAGRIWNHDSVS